MIAQRETGSLEGMKKTRGSFGQLGYVFPLSRGTLSSDRERETKGNDWQVLGAGQAGRSRLRVFPEAQQPRRRGRALGAGRCFAEAEDGRDKGASAIDKCDDPWRDLEVRHHGTRVSSKLAWNLVEIHHCTYWLRRRAASEGGCGDVAFVLANCRVSRETKGRECT